MAGLFIEGVSITQPRTGRHDPCPAVKAAGGYRACRAEDSAKCVLQPELFNAHFAAAGDEKRSGTTSREGIRQRQFQQDHGNEAEKRLYWSGHGKPSKRSESVGAVMQANRDKGGINDAVKEQKEAIYESNVREPLGKSHVRGHRLPMRVSEPGFRFGQPTGAPAHHSDQSGKDVIVPIRSQQEDAAIHEQYVRSHYAFSPGEQLQRRYAWPSEVIEDPAFRFGHGPPRTSGKDSVGNALFGGGAWSTDANVKTKIVQQNGEDYRLCDHDYVGKGRLGHAGRPPVPPGFSFGVGSKCAGTAGEAIRGNYAPQEQLPDGDLGKCVKSGCRNVAPTPAHVFGMPSGFQRASQRAASASAPSSRPMFQPPSRVGASSDKENVGLRAPVMPRQQYDDGGVAAAIAPGIYEAHDDLTKRRCRDEVRSLLKDSGCNVAPAEFSELWKIAARSSPSGDVASIDSFAKVYAEKQAASSVQKEIAVPARVNTHARVIGA